MQSLSFIISGTGIKQLDFEKLSNYIRSVKTHDTKVELIIHGQATHPYASALKDIRYCLDIREALVCARGNNVMFTSAANLLLDDNQTLITLGSTEIGPYLIVPGRRSLVSRILGLQMPRGVGYVMATRQFFYEHSVDSLSLPRLIKRASRDLKLRFSRSNSSAANYSFIKMPLLIRPYDVITLKLYRRMLIRIQVYLQKRKAARLRKRVPDVHYSKSIPVFIICRDRVEPLKKLVKWCEDEGLKNIFLIDNNSTYKPLLDYYQSTSHKVIKLRSNVGHTSPWVNGVVQMFANDSPFIVSDPDVIPDKNAHGAIKLFCRLLTEHPERTKVGFGLKIDDLPEHYELKSHVISWEKQFWVSEVESEVYDAEIDTTFALYRQNTPYTLGPALRTGGRFIARHEPWYIDSQDVPEEVKYYREHADKVIGSWGTSEDELIDTYRNNSLKCGS